LAVEVAAGQQAAPGSHTKNSREVQKKYNRLNQ